ncbi:unnamed protein product [Cyprideis torosa]|uniref:proton-translocating NAD(P)(+) transhydrogenase n=1 Tax=Cyprideis torosa TaxID=163714 RepID=A0A7R8ZV23_9CRUS|nr:unnamed protein product [Cyprideis torosa]CAG0909731.1 unnamed protein product [Cyprideis torosa]
MDMLPRTTLAQSMDVLSSQASIDGYRAVIEAAAQLPDYFPMFITAAGTVKPAKVLVLGAGVAGLQAIATAKRLGAVVHAMDTRAATETEVQSLGAKFVKLPYQEDLASSDGYAKEAGEELLNLQKEAILPLAQSCDIIVCTAKVRGKRAPLLIDESILDHMKTGSVVLDLATATGGNCSQSKADETLFYKQIKICGVSDYANKMPRVASQLYANNLNAFISILFDEEHNYAPDAENEIIKALISKVPTVLHTPLMSGSNAISGIVIIGAILFIRNTDPQDYFKLILSSSALVLAGINVVGGFTVTQRMLEMFKKKPKKP